MASKRVFEGFVPVVCVEFNRDLKLKMLRVFTIPLQFKVPGVISFIKVDSNNEFKRAIYMVKAGLALSELQLAYPLIERSSISEEVFTDEGCNVDYDIVKLLISPVLLSYSNVFNQVSQGNKKIVELNFNEFKIQKDLINLLNGMNRIARCCGEEVLDRFLRVAHLFALAVSQADYMSWIVLLNSSLEALSSTVINYCECIKNKLNNEALRSSLKKLEDIENGNECKRDRKKIVMIRKGIVETYQLILSSYTITDLRNVIVHGKSKNLDITDVEEIIYSHNNISFIEEKLGPKVRKALREFIENPEQFITKILDKIIT